MNGEISVESKLGEGSAFTVFLPMPVSHQAALPITETEKSTKPAPLTEEPFLANTSGTGDRLWHILLAEDNPTTQSLISILLEQMGIGLTVVDNGQAAIDSLAHQSVDLILMDCQMPQLDGFEATSQLRSQGLSIPIIALTAFARAEDEQQCLAAGMDDFLSKPFRQSELKAVIGKWLGPDVLSQETARRNVR